jgi:hypothetical protein
MDLQFCKATFSMIQEASQTSRKPSSVKSGATAEISGSLAAINFA